MTTPNPSTVDKLHEILIRHKMRDDGFVAMNGVNLQGMSTDDAHKAIEKLLTHKIIEARKDELESHRNQIGFNVGDIHLLKDEVDDRIKELEQEV